MSKRWLRYGLIGNLTTYGLGCALMGYLGWLIYDIGQNQSTKMDEQLAKQFFTFSDADLKQSAKKAKANFIKNRQQQLRRQQIRNQKRTQQNKRAQFI